MRQKLLFGIGWHGLHFLILLLKLVLLPLAWCSLVQPAGSCGHGGGGKSLWLPGAGAVKEELQCCGRGAVHFSALSLLLFGPLCCALPPVPVRAGAPGRRRPSCALQLAWWGQEARAPRYQLHPCTGKSLRAVSTSAERRRVCRFTIACGSLPLQLRGSHKTVPSSLRTPYGRMSVPEGCLQGGEDLQLRQVQGCSWQHRGDILQVGTCASRGVKHKLCRK